MANKETEPTAVPVLQSIEHWRDKKKTSMTTFSGAMVMAGWRAGKFVTEAEYDAALKNYLKAPCGRGAGSC